MPLFIALFPLYFIRLFVSVYSDRLSMYVRFLSLFIALQLVMSLRWPIFADCAANPACEDVYLRDLFVAFSHFLGSPRRYVLSRHWHVSSFCTRG